jgi:hypothetical protein
MISVFCLTLTPLRRHLQVYNHDLKEVNDAPVDTPWPLIWMLVRYSRKHIWCSKKKAAGFETISSSCVIMWNKIIWSWFFRNEESRSLPFRVPHAVTAPCGVVIDAAVESWISKFQRVVIMQLQAAKSRWKHNPQTNIMPVVKWAQRYTRDRPLVAIPCDKEIGFCLERLESHNVVQMDILMGNAYQEVVAQTVNNNVLFERYAKLCFAVAALEKSPDLAHEMVKSMRVVNASVCFIC